MPGFSSLFTFRLIGERFPFVPISRFRAIPERIWVENSRCLGRGLSLYGSSLEFRAVCKRASNGKLNLSKPQIRPQISLYTPARHQ